MLEIAAARGWNQPQPFILSPTTIAQDSYDGLTMLEVAALHGWTQPEVAVLTDLPQFSEANIEHLIDTVVFVADRHYEGDLIAACNGIEDIFESEAQFNHVLAILTGS